MDEEDKQERENPAESEREREKRGREVEETQRGVSVALEGAERRREGGGSEEARLCLRKKALRPEEEEEEEVVVAEEEEEAEETEGTEEITMEVSGGVVDGSSGCSADGGPYCCSGGMGRPRPSRIFLARPPQLRR